MSSTNSDSAGSSDDPIHIEHDYDSDTPPSVAIVQAIAAIENVDPMDSPTDLGIRLYDHFDPSALDQLITRTGGRDPIAVDVMIQNDHQYWVRVRDDKLIIKRLARDTAESVTGVNPPDRDLEGGPGGPANE